MRILQRRNILVFAVVSLLAFKPILAFAKTPDSYQSATTPSLTCDDLEGNIYQNGKDEELRKQAKLAEWNRYHEYVLGGLCDGDIEDLDSMVDQGYITVSDVEAIARALGKKYVSKSRTQNGTRYQKVREGLLKQNLCNACVSNIAEAYVKYPDSGLAKTVDAALAGDQTAMQKLEKLDSSSPLPDQPDITSSFWSKVVEGVALLAVMLLYLSVIIILGLSVFSKRFRTWLKTLDDRLRVHNINCKKLATIIGATCIAAVIFSDSRTPEEKACADDWRKCQDNQKLIDTGSHLIRMATACEIAASKQAKYGKPEFSTYSFSNYRPGHDYIETGVAFLIERDALFQNAFGTQVHTKVTCSYDLNRDAVQDVVIWD